MDIHTVYTRMIVVYILCATSIEFITRNALNREGIKFHPFDGAPNLMCMSACVCFKPSTMIACVCVCVRARNARHSNRIHFILSHILNRKRNYILLTGKNAEKKMHQGTSIFSCGWPGTHITQSMNLGIIASKYCVMSR